MDATLLWLPAVFLVIAAIYASVGFGGGSSYLAVLALIGLSYTSIPQAALVCNMIVSAGGVWHFRRAGYLQWHRVLPLVVLSVPMAYLGGLIPLGLELFMYLLGGSLLVAGGRMFLPIHEPKPIPSISTRTMWLVGLPLGGALGLLAGVVGIGGGIFLAPVLILSRWAGARATAATVTVFILVNSWAGLGGQLAKGLYLDATVVPLGIAVFLGGQIGSRLGSRGLSVVNVRRLTGALILVVSARILWGVV